MLQNQQRSPALEDLEAFVQVAETGSFTAAAKRLRVPKSTISRRIARLEEELDSSLVTRTSRRVTLSEAGIVYLERIAPALTRIEEASRAAREEREKPRGHLRITAPFDVAGGWLASILPVFRARHPTITIDVLVDDRRIDLVGEGVDLALRAAMQLEDSTLVARKLASFPTALWATPKYLRARGRPKTIDDLAAHDLLVFRGAHGSARVTLRNVREQPAEERTIDVRSPISSNDPTFLRRMTMLGAGIGLLPVLLGPDGAALERVLPDWAAGMASLFVVHPSARLVPAKVRAFRDFLIEQAPGLEKCSESARETVNRPRG